MDSYIISLIQNCTNRKVLRNEDWSVSPSELGAIIALLYMWGAYGEKNISLDGFWNKQGVVTFFQRLWLEIAFERPYNLSSLNSAAPGQFVFKLSNLIGFRCVE